MRVEDFSVLSRFFGPLPPEPQKVKWYLSLPPRGVLSILLASLNLNKAQRLRMWVDCDGLHSDPFAKRWMQDAIWSAAPENLDAVRDKLEESWREAREAATLDRLSRAVDYLYYHEAVGYEGYYQGVVAEFWSAQADWSTLDRLRMRMLFRKWATDGHHPTWFQGLLDANPDLNSLFSKSLKEYEAQREESENRERREAIQERREAHIRKLEEIDETMSPQDRAYRQFWRDRHAVTSDLKREVIVPLEVQPEFRVILPGSYKLPSVPEENGFDHYFYLGMHLGETGEDFPASAWIHDHRNDLAEL